MQFNNVWKPLYRFCVKKQKIIRFYNFFSPSGYEKNDQLILKYFQ